MTSPPIPESIFLQLSPTEAKMIAKILALTNHILVDKDACLALAVSAHSDTMEVLQITTFAIAGYASPKDLGSIEKFNNDLHHGLLRINRLAISLMDQAAPATMAEARADLGLSPDDGGH